MNLLEINGLTAAYGKNRVLDKVTFSIQSGELCALLGLNGSGKTTLLNSICGFTTFDLVVKIQKRNKVPFTFT